MAKKSVNLSIAAPAASGIELHAAFIPAIVAMMILGRKVRVSMRILVASTRIGMAVEKAELIALPALVYPSHRQ